MNHAPLPDIQPDMRDLILLFPGREEHQVARTHLVTRYGGTISNLVAGRPRNLQFAHIIEHAHNQPRTVGPLFRGSAIYIAGPQPPPGFRNQRARHRVVNLPETILQGQTVAARIIGLTAPGCRLPGLASGQRRQSGYDGKQYEELSV